MNKKLLPLQMINAVLLVAVTAFVLITYVSSAGESNSIESKVLVHISSLLLIFTLVSGFLYIIWDYSKRGAKYYKAFMVLFAVSEGASILSVSQISIKLPLYILIPVILSFALAVILATGKDLGKRNTMICCGLMIVANIVVLCAALSINTYPTEKIKLSTDATEVARLIVSITAFIMATGKYIDKTARGTK